MLQRSFNATQFKPCVIFCVFICLAFISQPTRGDGLEDVKNAILQRRQLAEAWRADYSTGTLGPELKASNGQDEITTQESLVVDLTRHAFRRDLRPILRDENIVEPRPIDSCVTFDGELGLAWYPRQAKLEDPKKKRVAMRKIPGGKPTMQSIVNDPLMEWLGFFSGADFFDHPEDVLKGYQMVSESRTEVVLERTDGNQSTQYFFSKPLGLNLVKLVRATRSGEVLRAQVVQTVEYKKNGQQDLPDKVLRRFLGKNLLRVKTIHSWKSRKPLEQAELVPPEGFLRQGMLIGDETVPGARPLLLDAITGEKFPANRKN